MGGATLLLLFGGSGSGPTPVVVVRSREYDILAEIRRLLDATGSFAAVRLHGPDEYEEDAPDHEVKAFVEIMGWDEDSDADDEDGPREKRDVTWRLTIEVRDANPIRRFQRLSSLANLAANTLNGVSYLGQTVEPLSRLTRAAYSEADHPYRQIQIDGKFTLLPEGYDGHDDYTADIDMIL